MTTTAAPNDNPETAPASSTAPAVEKQGNTDENDKSSPPKLDMTKIAIGEQEAPKGIAPSSGDDSPPENNAPQDKVEGLDAEKRRGRKRKYANAEEAAAAKKEQDRQRRLRDNDKERIAAQEAAARATGKPQSAPQPLAPVGPQFSPDALAGAGIIMQSLDTVCTVISNGEIAQLPTEELKQRAILHGATHDAWAQYLDENNAKLPGWALVLFLSGTYCAPAFRTPTAREKLGFAWVRFTGWLKKRMGG